MTPEENKAMDELGDKLIASIPTASIHKMLYHKDFPHMSIDIFHESAQPNMLQYRVKAAELEFVGSREFDDTEKIVVSLWRTIDKANAQLQEIVTAQMEMHTEDGGRLQ